jgi:hypothetical protein
MSKEIIYSYLKGFARFTLYVRRSHRSCTARPLDQALSAAQLRPLLLLVATSQTGSFSEFPILTGDGREKQAAPRQPKHAQVRHLTTHINVPSEESTHSAMDLCLTP